MKKSNSSSTSTAPVPDNGGMSAKGEKLMSETPIWKAMLKMSVPAMIMMMVFGGYIFADNLLAIQLAPDHYAHGDANAIRMYMSAFNPLNAFITAFAMMFGVGISTRVSINLGAKRGQRAKNTLKTGTSIGMAVSVLLIPILLVIAKPWMASQFPSAISGHIADVGFDYGWIIIMSTPLVFFNQIISGIFRTEGRNKDMLLPIIASIVINLVLDWVFMGPGKMGIEGGAWATFIAAVFTSLAYIALIIKNKKSIVQFKNLFGRKFKAISIIGIILVGLTPFFRNFAQSIAQTTEMNTIKDVSSAVYHTAAAKDMTFLFNNNPAAFHQALTKLALLGNNTKILGALPADQLAFAINASASTKMTLILTGVFPLFGLFFPIMFGFSQGATPIASYNFGAKQLGRVKQTFWYTFLYSSLTGVIIFFLVGWVVGKPLMQALGIEDHIIKESIHTLKIMFISLPMFGFAIAAMVLLSATDRIWLAIIVSSLRGLIYFFPVIFLFKDIAIHNPSNEYLFWWFYPAVAGISVLTGAIISMFVLKHLDKRVVTLDETLTNIYKKISERHKRLISKRKAQFARLKGKKKD